MAATPTSLSRAGTFGPVLRRRCTGAMCSLVATEPAGADCVVSPGMHGQAKSVAFEPVQRETRTDVIHPAIPASGGEHSR